MHQPAGYWPSPWPGEDGGPARRQLVSGRSVIGRDIHVTSRLAQVSTMVVLREPGEVFLLCHTGGDDAVSWVEQIDPETLAPLARSVDLAGGPTWPGGLAAHANGALYVAFGHHLHRLNAQLELETSVALPRHRPYNSFVILPDGVIVTKEFGGALAGRDSSEQSSHCELLAIDPETLEVIDRLDLSEGSVARLSARHNDVYVVTMTRLVRVRWDGTRFIRDDSFDVVYVTREGQGFGWDPVLTDQDAWFLDNGAGSQHYAGSLLGLGESATAQQLVRVGLADGQLTTYAVHDEPASLVANPPAIDARRGIAVGYDSAHGVVTAFSFDDPSRPLWTKRLNQAMHPLVLDDAGLVVLNDFDAIAGCDNVVWCELASGEERGRVATESPLQSVLFAAPGFDDDLYVCSFSHVSRVTFAAPGRS